MSEVAKTPVVGIDLGTTHSLVAYCKSPGKPEILPSLEGERLVPSVLYREQGEWRVGYAAREKRSQPGAIAISSIKRLLGKKLADIESFRATLPFAVDEDIEGQLQVVVGEERFTPIELSSIILRFLKDSAEKSLEREVTRAVITVPAYFNDAQRQATRLAGRIAGLDVLRIVSEPTAAALAYGADQKKNGLFAVYDLGGGTFDCSILKLEDGLFEVLSTHGNTQLGGDDFDHAIAKFAAERFSRELGFSVMDREDLRGSFLNQAELVKKTLSSSESASFEFVVDGRVLSFELTRSDLKTLAQPLIRETIRSCEQALSDAGITTASLTDFLLVGGATRILAVREGVADWLGRLPNSSLHPDEVVALGAAVQASILAGETQGVLLLDVVPLSLGIEAYGDVSEVLIARNTKIPAQARESFTTYVDNQTAVDIHVIQGEREKASLNRSLARFKLRGIEPGPAGFPRIEVRFLVDADGILQVSAKDMKTGKLQSIEVRPTVGLGAERIATMIESAMANASEDFEHRRWMEVRTKAEPVLRATEARLADARRLLPPEEYESIATKTREMRAAIEAKDAEKTQNYKYELNSMTVKLAELVVKETLSKR